MTRDVLLTAGPSRACRDELNKIVGVRASERFDLGNIHDEMRLADGITGFWAVVAGGELYSRNVLGAAAASGLRVIVRWGIGTDTIDIPAATESAVAVVTTPGANSEAVADMALALMLACLRRLPELDAAIRSGAWRIAEPAADLTGATVGIVGLGAIGKAVARRVQGFGCRVIAAEPNPDREYCAANSVELAELHDLLPRVDVLTLHAPLTVETRHLIGARELALLPRHAVLINTCRGPLVDQAALVETLRDGAIAAAGLDTFEYEPLPSDDPLTGLQNVILTGHTAGFTRLAIARTGHAVVAHLQAALEGRLPESCLNPQAWS